MKHIVPKDSPHYRNCPICNTENEIVITFCRTGTCPDPYVRHYGETYAKCTVCDGEGRTEHYFNVLKTLSDVSPDAGPIERGSVEAMAKDVDAMRKAEEDEAVAHMAAYVARCIDENKGEEVSS